jgi:2-succinyl-5-enolpyruvyl-6-hydroxy-3-cyclohexene-1-carboxylate synthase
MNVPAVRSAQVLLQALAAQGLRHVVLSPGSRSAPLAYAVAEAARPDGERDPHAPGLDVHVRVDERCAGYLAVGLARAAAVRGDGDLVAVVTTSGSAVANLHPAVLEAHHAGLPLLLLTADRPHELRGTGANQTTDQVRVFTGAVRLLLDMSAPIGHVDEERHLRRVLSEAVALATGAGSGDPGPVHVNLAYREPLVPDGEPWPVPLATRPVGDHAASTRGVIPPGWNDHQPGVVPWSPAVPTAVVAGDGAGPMARRIAETNGWPLLAEPSSGSRGGPNAIACYPLVLGSLGAEIRRVVVLGRPTLSRAVHELLVRRDVESLVVAALSSAHPEIGRGATHIVERVPPWLLEEAVLDTGAGAPSEWLVRWQQAGRAALRAVQAVLDAPPGGGRLTGPALAAEVASALGRDDVLLVGASNPIRDIDLVAAWTEPPLVVANRGLSGIDGSISTAAGLALGLARPVRAYLGDLTFLHDVGGLLTGPLERRPDLQVIVANDDGGSVFATLEHGEPERVGVFERVFATPHGATLAALCAGYGVPHVRVDGVDGLRAELKAPVRGTSVVEVPVDRTGRRDLHNRLAAAVTTAVSDAVMSESGG